MSSMLSIKLEIIPCDVSGEMLKRLEELVIRN